MSKQIKHGPTTILLALVVVGVLVVAPLWELTQLPDRGSMTAIAHDAKVTGVRVAREKKKRYYTPTFTFEDSDHRSFEAASYVRYRHDFRVGEVYQVRYDPYNPEAGCLIVGDDDQLRSRVSNVYLSLAGGGVAVAYFILRNVRLRRTSDSPDEARG